jgi:hypothetical protein
MSKGINIHCTICGRSKHQHIPSKAGESGHRTEEVYVAGCDKCAKERSYSSSTSHSSGGGGYSGGGSSGCAGTIGTMVVIAMIAACCCGGFGGKS